MAKYIDKNSLPCFKYLNEIPNDLMREIVDVQKYFMSISGKVAASMTADDFDDFVYYSEKCLDVYAPAIFKDNASMNGIPKRLQIALDSFLFSEDKLFDYRVHLADMVITECRRITQIASLSKTLQGMASSVDLDEDGNRIVSYPKLLLIEEELYISHYNHFSMNFENLFDEIYPGTAYNTFVQTSQKAGKYGFCIRMINDELIRITLLDRITAGYTFDLKRAGKNSFSLFPAFTCAMKDGTICGKGKHIPCVMDENECPTKKLPVVRSVLLCVQDYFKNKTKNIKNEKRRNKNEDKNIPEKFRMDGLVSVFDYYNKKEKAEYIHKEGNSRSGYRVRPHVRRSYERNLKNGGTTRVRATIIHKDEYKGYESCERINV